MKIIIYYQSRRDITTFGVIVAHVDWVINTLADKGHEVHRSIDPRYHGRRTLLLEDIRGADYVIFVTDFKLKRDYNYSSFDIDVLTLLARHPKSAVLGFSCSSVPENLECPDTTFFTYGLQYENFPFFEIINDVETRGSTHAEISDDFDVMFTELYKPAKRAVQLQSRRRFHEKLRRLMTPAHKRVILPLKRPAERLRSAYQRARKMIEGSLWTRKVERQRRFQWSPRNLRNAVVNPAGDVGKRLGGASAGSLLHNMAKLDKVDPRWRDRENERQRYQRVSNWLSTVQFTMQDLWADSPFRTEIERFAEHHPEELLRFWNQQATRIVDDQDNAADIIMARGYITSLLKVHDGMSLWRFERDTCKLIEKYPWAVTSDRLHILLHDYGAAGWDLTKSVVDQFEGMVYHWQGSDSEWADEGREAAKGRECRAVWEAARSDFRGEKTTSHDADKTLEPLGHGAVFLFEDFDGGDESSTVDDAYRSIRHWLEESFGTCTFFDGDLQCAAGERSNILQLVRDFRNKGCVVVPFGDWSTLARLDNTESYLWTLQAIALWSDDVDKIDHLHTHLQSNYQGYLRIPEQISLKDFAKFIEPMLLKHRLTLHDGDESGEERQRVSNFLCPRCTSGHCHFKLPKSGEYKEIRCPRCNQAFGVDDSGNVLLDYFNLHELAEREKNGPYVGLEFETKVWKAQHGLSLPMSGCGPYKYRASMDDFSGLKWHDRIKVRVLTVDHPGKRMTVEYVETVVE